MAKQPQTKKLAKAKKPAGKTEPKFAGPGAGDKAPMFNLVTDGHGKVSLKDLLGKPVVLYFYPKDDTSGCTQEAIAFSRHLPAFRKLGASVIGVSKDSVESHDKFKSKHKLGVALGSDPDGATVESYGCWVEKSMYGRTYMGIDRSTFLIDAKGRISRVWRKVKVPGHAEEVLEALKTLASAS